MRPRPDYQFVSSWSWLDLLGLVVSVMLTVAAYTVAAQAVR